MPEMRKYALVGTGGRAVMFVNAVVDAHKEHSKMVGFCDLSQTRMDWHNQRIAKNFSHPTVPTYLAADFDKMVREQKPDVVIVTSMDSTHDIYIVRAMELGCDVICEKPMTTDEKKAKRIFDTIERTGRSLRVTFNGRYLPTVTRLRELIISGVIGAPMAVELNWALDTRHGADYFRRWHREKDKSGGLLLHKSTHHFDMVNFWVDSFPTRVCAIGEVKFYGRENARKRGETYAYDRYTGVPEAANDPFALSLDSKDSLRGLYLEAEKESGYIRDRNVFGDNITSEDTVGLVAQYDNGVILTYSLLAYSPWEGYRATISGTKGRIELFTLKRTHIKGPGDQEIESDRHGDVTLTVFPMFQPSYQVEVPSLKGSHGGSDALLLRQIFDPNATPDPLNRAASEVDGAASILLGIAANHSMETGQMVRVDDLFPLTEMKKTRARVASALHR